MIGLRRWLTDNWSGFYVAGWLLIPSTTLPPSWIVLVVRGRGGDRGRAGARQGQGRGRAGAGAGSDRGRVRTG